MSAMQQMGKPNTTQGVCGFTSCLYAVYENLSMHLPMLSRALRTDTMHTRLMAEIKTFHHMLLASGQTALLSDIELFTKSFKGFSAWSWNTYLGSINAVTTSPHNIPNYSVALTPLAVQKYLSMMWSVESGYRPWYVAAPPAILGLTDGEAPRTRCNNLKHYVYMDSVGAVHSWGKRFIDFNDFKKQYPRLSTVLFTITLEL